MSSFKDKKPHYLTGDLLKRHRLDLKIPKSQVAKKLRITAQFYGHMESGLVGVPSDMVLKVLKLLKIKNNVFMNAVVTDYSIRVRRKIFKEESLELS